MPRPVTACDAVVVGAGPAGATAATCLARAGRRVTLLDTHAFPRDKVCGDLIGGDAVALMRRLDLAPELLAATEPLRGAFVYAPNGSRLGATLDARAAAALGARVIPRTTFDAALVAGAIGAGAAFRRARVVDVVRDGDGSVAGVALAGGETVAARLTIGADGWSSVVARTLVGTPRAPGAYGIAARVYVDGLAPQSAMRFFIGAPGDGYGWIFPLGAGAANVGLGFVRDEPGAGAIHDAFARFLRRPELRGGVEREPRRVWPIPFGWRATPVCGNGVMLAGDAASLASALSGSGIHTAIASGALAANVAHAALASGDVRAVALRPYERGLRSIARRLRWERALHFAVGTPAAGARAIAVARRVPAVDRLAVGWLLKLG